MTEQATIAQTILPPATSADSKRNAFYTDCRTLQVKKPYAMCQYIIEHTGDASLQVLYSDCLTEIRQGRCTALGMREEEKLKGQAIYFVERVKGAAVVAQQDAWVAPARKISRSGYQRDKYAAGTPVAPTPSRPAPAPKPAMPEFDGNIYAAALNIAAKRTADNATNRQPPQIKPEPAALAPVPATPAASKVAAPQPVSMDARAGESPLEMARRLRAAQTQPQG
ncbi:hypothetical protein AB6809_29915 [Paraburkholderia sp. RCC_158]|uniref:hypothetical protein n=1 Tax=Paraburkholderia sp. RCC_158 TaxID=3239220 RepID=UPI003523EF22